MFPPATAPTPARAWGLLGVRLGAVLVFSGVMWAVARVFFDDASFPPNTMWATLGLLPVNVLSLLLVRRFYRASGQIGRASCRERGEMRGVGGAVGSRQVAERQWLREDRR